MPSGEKAMTVATQVPTNATEGFRRVRPDAAEAIEKALPAVVQRVAKGTYFVFYYFAFGIVFASEVVFDVVVPDDHVIRHGLRDGAAAAMRKSKAAEEVAECIEIVEDAAEVV
jgi:hypothetical protein